MIQEIIFSLKSFFLEFIICFRLENYWLERSSEWLEVLNGSKAIEVLARKSMYSGSRLENPVFRLQHG